MTPARPTPHTHTRAAHWQRTRRLSVKLLAVWLAATFLVVFFARELSGVVIFGWPLSFYMAAQGMTFLYLIIVAIYAWRMRHYDNLLRDEEPHGE